MEKVAYVSISTEGNTIPKDYSLLFSIFKHKHHIYADDPMLSGLLLNCIQQNSSQLTLFQNYYYFYAFAMNIFVVYRFCLICLEVKIHMLVILLMCLSYEESNL